MICSNCQQPNAPEARFCSSCGAPLAAGERREERKVVTVLFADLAGFTSRSEQMDVEDVRAMQAPYYALVREKLEQRGGTVEKFIGDAVMAVFGAPAAREDDPERGVRAGLAIREALAALNERNPELDLHVRVGINTGEALVSLDANVAAGESIASGDVVNTAFRLQEAAPTDSVVVGAFTYRATRDAIEYEETEPIQAKGKSAPVRAWRAVRARSRVGETRRQQDAARLIDRVGERKAVFDAFEETRTDRCVRAVTLVGVPGIGKSRLVRELFRDLDRRPELVRWREGRSPPYGDRGTFWALGEIVKAEAGLLDSQESATAAAKLETAVATLISDPDEAEWVTRHLRALVGVDAGTALFGDRRAEAFAAWRLFIERLAEHRPTVLVFEDLQWADDALVDFIEHLVAWASSSPLFVLCTARPELLERRPQWSSESATARIVSLSPLSDPETHDLFDVLLGNSLLPEGTRTALLRAAEGNPLYAEEFVRMLVDRNILVQREGQWVVEETRGFPVPDSVLGIISARLDAIPASDKSVIQDAAVVGKVFWPAAVASVAGRGRWAVEEALRRLEQRQLVRRRGDSSVAGDSEWAFEHALIRDVAYRTIVRRSRAEKHKRAAEWLSSLTGDPRDRADAIAYHYVSAFENARASGETTAELREATSRALAAAAEHAGSLHSHAVAAQLWGQALALTDPGDNRRPALLLEYGKALALADEPAAEVLDHASAALIEAGSPRGAAEAESTRGWLLSVAGDPEQARKRDERALELAREAESSHAKALISTRAGAHMIFVPERRDEALGLLEEGLAMAQSLGLREMEAEALQFVGMARLDAGDEDGVHDIEKALTIAADLTSPVSLSCYGNLADMRRYLGSLTESAELHILGESAARRFGIPVQLRRFRAEQACDLYYSGNWDAAVAHVDEYLGAIETGSPHRGAGEARLHRGRIRLARGDGAGALEDAQAALEFGRATGEPFNLFPALAFYARASAGRSPEQADASVTELLDALATGQPFWGAWALPDLLAALREERYPELRRLLDRSRPHTRWYGAVLAAIDGDFTQAAVRYAEIGSQPDEAVARLGAAKRALAAGDGSQAQDHVARALAFFSSVGAQTYVRDAELLASA